MPIPDYETLMLPFLTLLSDGQVRHMGDIRKALEEQFNLSPQEISQRIPSGQSTVMQSRTGWARTYLKKAALIESESRARYRITPRGLEVLKSKPSRIDNRVLRQFPEFLEFLKPKPDERSPNGSLAEDPVAERQTPLETLGIAYKRLRRELSDELLQTVTASSPSFFERLVVDLLVKMGYGGSLKDAGQAVGRSGDDGVDGIIKEDRLGLDQVYIQAKRWSGSVGRPEVQSFAGSLEGHRARKGVFITTSQFTKDAREYVNRIEKKIVLIDGEQLAQLMIDFGVGVSEIERYVIQKLDRDYFDET